MSIEGAIGNGWLDKLTDRVADRIADRVADRMSDDGVVAMVSDDESAPEAVDAGVVADSPSPAESVTPAVAIPTVDGANHGPEWVVATTLLRTFIQLSAALAAVLAGGSLSAFLVARQQRDAATTAPDQTSNAVLQASAAAFSDAAATLLWAGVGCFAALVIVLALEAIHEGGSAQLSSYSDGGD